MNNAKQVDALVAELKAAGKSKAEIAWQTALACVSWPYVFGARGEYCTVQNRHRFYSDAHPTIRTKCKGYDSGSCSGCKWYPGSERVRMYDCRGFTYWCLKQVGVPLQGAGATSQWNDAKNWASKGTVDAIPPDTLVCLFVQKGKKMEHTGFGYNNETVECSSGVQHFKSRAKKWTHWGVPAGLYDGDIPTPEPTPEPTPDPSKRPTLRRGDKGPYVIELQTDLVKLGYGIGPCGIDGVYGKATKAAVEQLQLKHGLVVDGICGPKTWAAIDQDLAELNAPAEPVKISYTVQIPGLDLETAKKIAEAYQGAEIVEGSVSR
jgi:hypothetical protein